MATYTITNDVANGVDDGFAIKNNGVYTAANFGSVSYSSSNSKRGKYVRFKGITIPSNATISTATLTYFATLVPPQGTSKTMIIQADKRNTTFPLYENTILSPTSTTGTPPSQAVTHAGYPSTPSNFSVKNTNVKPLVDALLTLYGSYTAGVMTFYMNIASSGEQWAILIYQRNWGTTQDAQLVISYSIPSLVPKTIYRFV